MIPESKMLEIARGLLEKTRKETVKWREECPGSLTCVVDLPRSQILLGYASPTTEPDYIELTLRTTDQCDVGKLRVGEDDRDWAIAHALYSAARNYVTGCDKILEEVERFIS